MTELELMQSLAGINDKELIQKAKDTICELAKTYGRSHRMSIPPSANDTDMLLMEIVDRYEKVVNKLPIHDISGFLPSEDDIKEAAAVTCKHRSVKLGWILGAKWMRGETLVRLRNCR